MCINIKVCSTRMCFRCLPENINFLDPIQHISELRSIVYNTVALAKE